MKPSDLHSVWSMPDNSRLTAKQYSFRLPVHVAAKLAALGELYPSKTRTQIVADLLATAIEQAVAGLPSIKGRFLDHIEFDSEPPFDIYEDVGLKGRFKQLANTHYAELEEELGNEAPGLAYDYEFTSGEGHDREAVFVVQADERR